MINAERLRSAFRVRCGAWRRGVGTGIGV